MKENTKYHDYRFVGKILVDEIQPWFDFTSLKPWDEPEVPWVLDNKVRRQILITLTATPKSLEEIYKNINFSPKPLLISKEEHTPGVIFQWTKETIENHLLALEWYNLIEKQDNKYVLMIPIYTIEEITNLEPYILKYAQNWIKVIQEIKEELSNLSDINTSTQELLIEKAIEKLYILLKEESLLPDIPNLKLLWGEQLRKVKFEEWIKKNF